MTHIISKKLPGSRILLLGNEAVARGAIESNVEIAASYPGTPASEIVDTLALVADEIGMHVQWSTNEMVAFEVALGGAICGKRSMASMKHIGANWIVDPLMHAVYHGFDAGFVLVSADDPSGHSSANEQDSRYLAQLAEIPVIEPSDVQEAKDYLNLAFEISEELRLPVMFRLVTRICHSRGDCKLGELNRKPRDPKFHDDYYSNFVLGDGIVGPKVIPELHALLHQKNRKVEDIAVRKGLFMIEHPEKMTLGNYKVGIITASAPANYVLDFLKNHNLRGRLGLLKMGLTNPFPNKTVLEFIKKYEEIIVVEEGEPFIERQLSMLTNGIPSLKVHGKLTSTLPLEGELNYTLVEKAISNLLGVDYDQVPNMKIDLMAEASKVLTPRTLTMCAGCPHRGAYYAAKKATRNVSNAKYIALGDIGCYTLGMYPPLRFMQDVFCMGGSIGVANGVAKSGIKEPIFATIGDSTFYHAGIPGLINATFNQANIKIMVLDNEVTAMTGFQPHPGCGETATLKPTKRVTIEDICKACGIEFIKIVDPYDLKASVSAMEEAIKFDGPAVVIFRRLCSQEYLRQIRRQGKKLVPFEVSSDKCIGCRTCTAAFGCPAIGFDRDRKKSFIQPLDCVACGVCEAVCPNDAISKKDVIGGQGK
ncbi:MAG: indolepyruvate ferredoxin oxidoreductase subunit alpha [Candidatus Methanomethylicus sp.]|nr:indolepyruvate ferredoxin oxidoreductase subunit alpha [Candidatus Methanomethylicus sp.]